MGLCMSQQIAVRVPREEVAALDEAVAKGLYPTRADAVRAALALLLRQIRDEEIVASHQRAFAEQPDQEPTAGIEAWEERVRSERERAS